VWQEGRRVSGTSGVLSDQKSLKWKSAANRALLCFAGWVSIGFEPVGPKGIFP